MKLLKGYKFRLKPTAEIEQKFRQAAGSCRFVWNKALAIQKGRLEEKLWCFSYSNLALQLPFWKRATETEFLRDCPSQPLQQTLKHLTRAIRDAFDKKSQKKFPVFKRKLKHDSFSFPVSQDNIRLENRRIKIPKIGWVGFFKSKEIKGAIKNITISRSGQHWFVSLQTVDKQDIPTHPSNSQIGIDVGVKRFAILSNKQKITPLNIGKKLAPRLALEQRKLARKIKFSSNWKKQVKKVNKVYQKIINSRNDFLHKESTKISKNHAIIFLEELKIKNMTKSAKGTKTNPGRNVKAKSGLNKSILEQGWYEFRRQLDYKSGWNGGKVFLVNPKNTSRKCPECDFTHADNRKTQANFSCISCGYRDNADYVAALNILALGQSVIACGEGSMGLSTKQEPVRNRKVVSLHKNMGIPFL